MRLFNLFFCWFFSCFFFLFFQTWIEFCCILQINWILYKVGHRHTERLFSFFIQNGSFFLALFRFSNKSWFVCHVIRLEFVIFEFCIADTTDSPWINSFPLHFVDFIINLRFFLFIFRLLFSFLAGCVLFFRIYPIVPSHFQSTS